MSVYDVKIKRLALLLLPTALRKPLVAAFMQSAVQGCSVLHGEFMRWRDDKDYRLWHNGQVCHLRAVLNDTFDQTERRITVDDEDSGGLRGARLFTRDMDRHILLPVRGGGKAFIINRRGYGGVSGFCLLGGAFSPPGRRAPGGGPPRIGGDGGETPRPGHGKGHCGS